MNSQRAYEKSGLTPRHILVILMMTLVACAGTGIMSNCMSIFVKPISNALGLERGNVAIYFSLISLANALFQPVAGALIAKLGPRRVILFTGLVHPVLLLTFSLCGQLWQLYGVSALLGLTLFGTHTITLSTVINAWFHKNQGLVLGIVLSGNGIGGMVLSYLASHVMESSGWPAAVRVLALAAFLLAVPLNLLLLRDRPQQLGLAPYGDAEQAGPHTPQAEDGIPYAQAVKLPAFWLTGLLFYVTCLFCFSVQQNITAYYTDAGLSLTQAAGIYSLMLGFSIPSKMLFGAMADRLGPKITTVYGMVCFLLSLLLMLFTHSPAGTLAFSVLFALANPVMSLPLSILNKDFFGSVEYSKKLGILSFLQLLGVASSGAVTGKLFDLFHSYRPIFAAYGILAIALTAGYFLLCGYFERRQHKGA